MPTVEPPVADVPEVLRTQVRAILRAVDELVEALRVHRDAAIAALEALQVPAGVLSQESRDGNEWHAERIEATLREVIVEGLGIKPRFAFGPLRTAVSGARISPPLFESMEILGKHSTLARLRRLRATYEGSPAEG